MWPLQAFAWLSSRRPAAGAGCRGRVPNDPGRCLSLVRSMKCPLSRTSRMFPIFDRVSGYARAQVTCDRPGTHPGYSYLLMAAVIVTR